MGSWWRVPDETLEWLTLRFLEDKLFELSYMMMTTAGLPMLEHHIIYVIMTTACLSMLEHHIYTFIHVHT